MTTLSPQLHIANPEWSMPNSERFDLTTSDGVRGWIIDHDARIDTYWEAQHKLNDRNESKFDSLVRRVSAMEIRVAFYAGIASIVGATIGAVVGSML